jgi:hypothetical protein
MTKIQRCQRIISACCLSLLLGGMQAMAQTSPPPFLLQVTFTRIDFIHTGELANFTGPNQSISFRVFPTQLVNSETQENLLNGPDAFFAVRNSALRLDDPARSTQYCLDIVRSLAINSTSGAELSLFLQVTNVTGTNFVVHRFNSCALQLPQP